MDDYTALQQAVFERFTSRTSWKTLSATHQITIARLRTAYARWMKHSPESQQITYEDIHISIVSPGRPCSLSREQENTIADAIRYFASNHTPLTKQGVLDLVEEYVTILPRHMQELIGFKRNRPSFMYLKDFLLRKNLDCCAVRQVEDKRVLAMTPDHMSEHIALVQSAMDRYNIHDAKYIFNMDQSGCSLRKIVGRSLLKGVGPKDSKLVQKTIGTKGDLDRVTIMPVVSAVGKVYTPFLIFPGKTPHYRRVRGQYQMWCSGFL